MGKPWHVFLPGQVLSDCPGVSQFWRDGVMKHGKKPTVVVINDDATQRATLIGLLEGAGCRGLEFEGAEEALGVLTAQPPELVVTDLHMPGLDGWRLCRLLRSPEFAICNHIPILVVSATFSGDEPRRLTAGMGANAFLPFPVEGDAFKGLVVQLLAGQVPPVAPRVLVVEDDPDLAAAVCEGFVLRGCQVAVAQSGEEARQALREGAPDTVVLDYHLPDLKGDRLLAELQGLESGPAVVMMTGDVNPELALRFVKMGARAFVHKPFEVEYLISLCDSAWRERCLLRVEHLLEQRTRQLRESDERFRVMADNAPAMMLLVDTRGGVHQVNQAAREFCGQRCEPSPGLQLAQVLKCLHATEDPRGCGFGAQCCRCPFLHMAAEAIQSGRCRSRVEARLRVMANGRPTAVSLLASAARVEVSAQPMALLCLENVSALRRMEEQLRQAQKMEAVGQLAGGVAHDFNNILAAMLMQLGLLKCEPNLAPELAAALSQLEKGANRAATLTRQLLTFSRRQMMQVRPIDLNELLAELLKMLRRLLGEHIDLMVQGQTGPLWIEADAGMVEQVIVNLCVNARDAMPQGGRLTIKTEVCEIEASAAETSPEARPGHYACLTVADTGCGMDEETQGRIFEPFFTTKEVGKGTGLGLATAYGIVKQHCGWIEVESRVHEGSVFRVFLPACTTGLPSSAGGAAAALSLASRGWETILLVEDDEPVRSLAARCLEQLGYRVLEASDGVEALKRWNEQPGQIDLLLTDEVMPHGIRGLELAERLRQLKRKLKVIISSGYSLEMSRPSGAMKADICFLAKPYKFAELAATVRKCLDGKGSER